MDQVRIDTSMRRPVVDPTDIEWRADADDAPRHAFRPHEGYPSRGLCGIRWTTRFGRHGDAWCEACVAALKEEVRSATAALRVVEAADLAAGDHYAYPGVR